MPRSRCRTSHEGDMRRVILESPYAGNVARNARYARACLRDSLLRGEAPIASHLLYIQDGVLLRDEVSEERSHGIEAGLAWRDAAETSVVYEDFGISSGMNYGIDAARKAGRAVDFRSLPADVLKQIKAEFPD